MPVPCIGESVVKVVEIPTLARTEIDASGRKTVSPRDLGYKFSGCTGGEWVIHIGSDREYIALENGELEQMLRAAGLNETPPVPSFWSSGQAVPFYLWGAGIVLVAIGALFRKRGNAAAGARDSAPDRENAIEDDPRWAAVAAHMQSGPGAEPAVPPSAATGRPAKAEAHTGDVPPKGRLAHAGGPHAFGRRR